MTTEKTLREAVETLLEYRKRVREQLGEAVHTGFRKGADGGGATEVWWAISKCTTYGDAIEYALYGLEAGLEKRLAEAEAALSLPGQGVFERPGQDTPSGVGQEPKYAFRDGQVWNRASGEAVPLDEPVMVFRARDKHAAATIRYYLALVGSGDPEHVEAVHRRIEDFEVFARHHPERMKEPDTALTPAPDGLNGVVPGTGQASEAASLDGSAWQSVPREPTEAMLRAANNAGNAFAGSDLSGDEMTNCVWSAMLSAAPSVSSPSKEGASAASLPDRLDGHWLSADGLEMAHRYASMKRVELCMGDIPDLALANAVFMADRSDLNLLAFQTAAKDRIRWLSAQLALAALSPSKEGG